MRRMHDPRTGRPLVDGRDIVEELTLEELQEEVTIAASAPQRASRLNVLLRELEHRRHETPPASFGDPSAN